MEKNFVKNRGSPPKSGQLDALQILFSTDSSVVAILKGNFPSMINMSVSIFGQTTE